MSAPMRLLVLIVITALSACQGAPDPAHSEAEIRTAVQGWAAAFNQEDLEGVLASYSQDLILSYPGEDDMTTREAFRDLYAGTFDRDGGSYTFDAEIEEIDISGDMAFARITWTLTWDPEGADPYVVRSERAMEVWRYEADGVWRLHRWLGFPEPE
jgi:uncharacterized protein (TIGR02246 family)